MSIQMPPIENPSDPLLSSLGSPRCCIFLQPFLMAWGMISLGALSLNLGMAQGAIAQSPADTFPSTLPLEQPPDTSPAAPPSPPSHLLPPSFDPATQVIFLTLPDLIDLTLAGNRELRNETLQRIVQRQQLNAAEQKFDPRITPTLSVELNQDWASRSTLGLGEGVGTLEPAPNSDGTTFDQEIDIAVTLNTRLGTELEVGVVPLTDSQPFVFRIRQPLLRDFGRTVNEASVEQARLTESQNQLALRQQIIDTLTTAIAQYTTLIGAQETVKIQATALERRRQQLEILQALVAAGRRPQVDLFDAERSVADAERDLIIAQNEQFQANTALLNLIGTDQPIRFVASPEAIDQLFEAAIARVANLDQATLITTAYQHRPDYPQAQLEQQIRELDLLLAEDAQQWRLDVVGAGNLGDASETTLGLVAARTFDEPDLETARISSEVSIRQQENQLIQLQETIRNTVVSSLTDVQSNQTRVEAADRATSNAQQQLLVAQEKFRRGIDGVDIFQVISQEESLVNAQNAALQARIAFLNSLAILDKEVGITLETWAPQIDLEEVLLPVLPESP